MSPRRSALTGAAAVFVVVAAPVSAAQATAAPTSSASVRGLFDLVTTVVTTVSGTLNTLLGASQVTTLQGVTSALNGGAVPSTTTLAPVATWLNTLAANSALPADLRTSATQAVSTLTSGAAGVPLSPASAATVTSVLGQIAGTSGLDATGAATLTTLASALTASALAAAQAPTGGTATTSTAPALPAVPLPISNLLPGGGTSATTLPVGGDLLAPLQGVVTTLTALAPSGTAPSGSQLAPITALLRQLAALPGIDGVAGAALTQLAGQIDAQGGVLSTDLLATLTGTLDSVAATPGVPEPVTTVVKSISTLLGASTGAPKPAPAPPSTPKAPVPGPGTTAPPAATTPAARPKIGRVRISSARVDRKRGTIRVRVSCPSTGPACKTLLGVTRGGTLQSATGVLSIKAGGSLTQTLKLRAASRRLVRKKTTKFVVGALLPNGSYAAKTVTAKAPKAKKAKAKKAKTKR